MAICCHFGNFQTALGNCFLQKSPKFEALMYMFWHLKNYLCTVAKNLAIFDKMLTTFLSEHLVTLFHCFKAVFKYKSASQLKLGESHLLFLNQNDVQKKM